MSKYNADNKKSKWTVLDKKMDRYIKDWEIVKDPHFVECYDEIKNAAKEGKDLRELLEEYKQELETDPKFDTFKLIALCKYRAENKGSGRGGVRTGAGRKKGQKIKPDCELKKARSIRMTDEEYPKVLEYLKQMRADKK